MFAFYFLNNGVSFVTRHFLVVLALQHLVASSFVLRFEFVLYLINLLLVMLPLLVLVMQDHFWPFNQSEVEDKCDEAQKDKGGHHLKANRYLICFIQVL